MVGSGDARMNKVFIVLLSLANILISWVLYALHSYIFLLTFFYPFLASGIIIKKSKKPIKDIILCMLTTLIFVVLLRILGFIFTSINEVAVFVILVQHFFINILPYCFIILFMFLYQKAHL